jgi:hypothetical protein
VAFSRARVIPEAMHKRAKVVELRTRKMSFAEIGAEMGLTSQRCGQLYRQALADIPTHNVDEHRTEALEFADRMIAKLLGITGDAKAGIRSRIDAISIIRSWEEHKAKLVGSYAPLRTEVMTISSIDAEIAKLELELGVNSE